MEILEIYLRRNCWLSEVCNRHDFLSSAIIKNTVFYGGKISIFTCIGKETNALSVSNWSNVGRRPPAGCSERSEFQGTSAL